MAEIAKIHGQDIRDKKIADATDASSASDITSQCKFLLENGQTGEFMQVLKSYIDESVRSALGPLLNNLDKGTGLKAVAGIDSNNDLGTATLSNLASMLSAAKVYSGQTFELKYNNNKDINLGFTGPAIVRISAIPSSDSALFLLPYTGGAGQNQVILSDSHIGNLYVAYYETGSTFIRIRNEDNTTKSLSVSAISLH